MSTVSLYYLPNHRTAEQLAEMQRLEARGICIFCPEYLELDPDHPVLHRTAHWTVKPNKFPYRGTRLHLLLLPDAHVSEMTELPPQTQQDFWAALGWVTKTYELTHYGVAARNGLSEYTGSTIRHLHIHVIQGDVDDPAHEPVKFKLSSRRGDVDPDELDPRRA